MRINRVELKNIGPHSHLEVDFGKGLIGLVGSNGAGKSTLVNSIYAALTNDFSRFGNAKADIIKNGSTDSSFIKIIGEHLGQSFELIRWLKPNKSEFTIGSTSYSKATDINEAIVTQLNIPKIMIDKYVFVDQWQMFSFLDQSSAERAKTFQYLCGTDAAASAHKVCNDFVNRQQLVQVIDNSIELQEALNEQEAKLEELQQKIEEAQAARLKKKARERYQAIVDAMDVAIVAKRSMDQWNEKVNELRNEITSTKEKLEEVSIKLQKRVDWKNKNKEKIDIATKLLEAFAEYERQIALKQKATRVKTQAELKLRDLQPPAHSPDKYCPKAARDKLVEKISQLKLLVKQAKALELDSENCPHCNQPVSEDYRNKVMEELEANQALLEPLEISLRYSKQYDEAVELFKDTERQLTEKIENAEKTIASLDDSLLSFGDGDRDNAEALLTKFEQANTQITALTQEQSKLQKSIDFSRGELKSAKQMVSKFEAQVAERPAQQIYDDAVEQLQNNEQVKKLIGYLSGSITSVTEARDGTAEMLDVVKKKLERQAKIRNLTALVSEVADVFHWSNLPKVVAQTNLELLVADINDNLGLFNSPFAVEADDDLTLKVFLPGQLPVKAKQLSGGQKVILAIAFRAALDRVFGCDTGMMFLDEPTAGLDADNLNYFHNALQTLAQKVGDKQLVVITHVHEFKGTFDQVIEVTKA